MIPPCTCGHEQSDHGSTAGLVTSTWTYQRCRLCTCPAYTAASTWQSASASFPIATSMVSGSSTSASTASTFSGVTSFNPNMPLATSPPQVNPIHRMLRAEEGRVVVVIVPLANLASMSDVEVWRGIEKDLAYAADEVVIQRDVGEYVVIKDRNEQGLMPKKMMSISEQKKALERLRDRLE